MGRVPQKCLGLRGHVATVTGDGYDHLQSSKEEKEEN